jgi:hypothetical protein
MGVDTIVHIRVDNCAYAFLVRSGRDEGEKQNSAYQNSDAQFLPMGCTRRFTAGHHSTQYLFSIPGCVRMKIEGENGGGRDIERPIFDRHERRNRGNSPLVVVISFE